MDAFLLLFSVYTDYSTSRRKINTDFSKAAVTLIRGAVLHYDRGTQYTSALYRSTLRKNEELPDSTVVEVIVKLVSNPKFAAMMQEKISMKVVKARLMGEIDSLDPDDKHYIKRKADLDGRLYKMYDKIEDTENQLKLQSLRKI